MRVLSIIHGDNARSAVFGEVVRRGGHELDELSFAFGEPPVDPERYDAVMAFGGAMNVHEIDGHPWIAEEQLALTRTLEHGVPLLGICLGGQLLASVTGGLVSRAPEPEIGWYQVDLTPEAEHDPLFGGLQPRFAAYEWHSYQFDLPPGATPLAASAVCLQAFRVGDSAWGTQFHAEVTREIVETWISSYGNDPDAVRIGFDPVAQRARLDTEINRWNRFGRGLVSRFLAFAEERAGVAPKRASA